MSSFFMRNSDSRKGKKRPRQGTKKIVQSKKKPKEKVSKRADEEIASDSDDGDTMARDDLFHDLGVDEVLSDHHEETPAESRLRLAKQYLQELENEEKDDNDEVDHDAIAHRLKEDALENSGKLQKKVADQYQATSDVIFLKGHKLPVTACCISPDDRYVFTGSKDCCIIKWDVTSCKKDVVIQGHRKGLPDGIVGHTGHVLALAITSDGQYLASGATDKVIHIWNPSTCVHIHTFKGHKDSVSGLVFQSGSHELFSCSFDRTIKLWNIDELSYVETLFGHQDSITGIDCLSKQRPVTAGASDGTLRVWKIIEESHLVFNGHKASIDSVKLINNDTFISGSQDGSLSLWNITKKKPLATTRLPPSSIFTDNWVTTVTALPNTDLVASGSNDGLVHLWKIGEMSRSLDHLLTIPLMGFVNALSFSKSGDFLVVGVGQEHKLGRWWRETGYKNGLVIVKYSNNST